MKTSFIDIVQVLVVMFGIIGVSYSMPKTIDTPVNICPLGTFECGQRCIDFSERCDGRFVWCLPGESCYESFEYAMSRVTVKPPTTCPDYYRKCREGCRTVGEICDGRVIFSVGGPKRTTTTTTTEYSVDPCGSNRFDCGGVCKNFGEICDGREVW